MKYDFAELKKRNSMALQDLKAEGMSVVGTFCTYSPKELIYAAGAVPVSLCASDEGPINAAHAELPLRANEKMPLYERQRRSSRRDNLRRQEKDVRAASKTQRSPRFRAAKYDK